MNCPVCTHDSWKHIASHIDGTHEYVSCSTCGSDVVRLHPLFDFEQACGVYTEEYLKNFASGITTPDCRKSDFDGMISSGSCFLEFGPGPVTPALWLKESGCNVDLVEINNASLKVFRSMGFNAYKVIADIQKADKYDVVYSYHFLEHTLNVKLEVGIHCLLGKNVMIEVPVGLFEINNPDHNWLLSENSWRKIISRYGEIVETKKNTYGIEGKGESVLFKIKSFIE